VQYGFACLVQRMFICDEIQNTTVTPGKVLNIFVPFCVIIYRNDKVECFGLACIAVCCNVCWQDTEWSDVIWRSWCFALISRGTRTCCQCSSDTSSHSRYLSCCNWLYLSLLTYMRYLWPVSPIFNRQLKFTQPADLTKIWLIAFLQHLTDRQLHINLTGHQCTVN